MPELKSEAIALGRDDRLSDILRYICDTTGMGFAAVARVTEERWIACLVEDRIDFGLDAGGELKIRLENEATAAPRGTATAQR